MNKEEIIKQIKSNISLYSRFICPDYPDLRIYTSQYEDILIRLFNNAETTCSLIYSDINKLSVVNERYGKEQGDKTLHTLLRLFTKSQAMPKDALTVRIGGDEFITFVPNRTKEETEKIVRAISMNIEDQKDYLCGSSITFGVEDSSLGNYEKIFTLAEHSVQVQKMSRKQDPFLTNANTSKKFSPLPTPKNISSKQQEKWETLNAKINVAIDNHLRDIRPSSKSFQYDIDIIKRDAKTFIDALGNLLNIKAQEAYGQADEPQNQLDLSYEEAVTLHSLFQGNDVNLEALDEGTLNNIYSNLNLFCKSLIREPHSDLLKKSYFKLYLADALLDSKQNYQATYYSMSGIRPRNTAYGHSICDVGIEKTSRVLIDEYSKKHEFNNKPFTFDKNDSFLIDQGGGNFISFTPMDNALSEAENQEIVHNVNSHYTDDKTSTFKISTAVKNNVNRMSIPLFVNSSNEVKKSVIETIRTIYHIISNRLRKNKLVMGARTSRGDC
ncbi:MAG: diguanylate cyclase [Clostridia bacterium]|nr:diguanylate cyclase [Clostridia bacterium]